MPTPLFTPDAQALLTEEVADLVIRPLEAASVALQVARTVIAHEHTLRIPILTDDVEAKWVPEGGDLEVDRPGTDDVEVEFSKVGAVVRISSETQQDSTPEAATMVGESIARSIAKKIDHAFFNNDPSPAPKGLGGLTGVTVLTIGTLTNLDKFTLAAFTSAAENGTITSWCANPGDAYLVATLKDEANSARDLVTVNAAGQYVVAGAPLVLSPQVPLGRIWGIPQQLVIAAIRKDLDLRVSEDVFFTTDQVAVRAIMRVGFGYPAPEAIVRLDVTGGTPITGGSNS